MIPIAERVSELRAQIRTMIDRRPTGIMAVAVGILCAVVLVVVGPIAFYMLRQDIATALFLALGWGAVALVVVVVDTAARYCRELVKAPRSGGWQAPRNPAATAPPPPPGSKARAPELAGAANGRRPVVNPTRLPPPPTVHYRQGIDLIPDDPTPPTWDELRASGTIGRERPLYIGWDGIANLPVYATWDKQLGSLVIVGDAGAGKTTFGASIACQAVMQAMAKCLIVCDLETGKSQSLSQKLAPLESAYLRPVADTPEAIVEAIEFADQIAQSRKGDGHAPLVVLAEEWTSLRDQLSPALRRRLDIAAKSLAARGRKVNVVLVMFSQVGTKEACGPVRDFATTTVVFRAMPAQVRYAVETTIDLREYPDGVSYMRLLDRLLERVVTPLVEDHHIVAVGQLVASAMPASSPAGGSTGASNVASTGASALRLVTSAGSPVGSQSHAHGSPEVSDEGEGGSNVEGVTPEQRKHIIRAGEVAGATPARVAQEVLGAPDSGGGLTRKASLVVEVWRQHRAELAARVAELEAERAAAGDGPGGPGGGGDPLAYGGAPPGGDTEDA
jgi:hypothetical protein